MLDRDLLEVVSLVCQQLCSRLALLITSRNSFERDSAVGLGQDFSAPSQPDWSALCMLHGDWSLSW